MDVTHKNQYWVHPSHFFSYGYDEVIVRRLMII